MTTKGTIDFKVHRKVDHQQTNERKWRIPLFLEQHWGFFRELDKIFGVFKDSKNLLAVLNFKWFFDVHYFNGLRNVFILLLICFIVHNHALRWTPSSPHPPTRFKGAFFSSKNTSQRLKHESVTYREPVFLTIPKIITRKWSSWRFSSIQALDRTFSKPSHSCAGRQILVTTCVLILKSLWNHQSLTWVAHFRGDKHDGGVNPKDDVEFFRLVVGIELWETNKRNSLAFKDALVPNTNLCKKKARRKLLISSWNVAIIRSGINLV